MKSKSWMPGRTEDTDVKTPTLGMRKGVRTCDVSVVEDNSRIFNIISLGDLRILESLFIFKHWQGLYI